MFKTKIVRQACKIPLYIIQHPSKWGAVIDIKVYKANDIKKYLEAYSKVFHFVWSVLSDENLIHEEPSDKHFIDFICLHFPAEKVLEVAKLKNLED